jgi:uncharacterized protein
MRNELLKRLKQLDNGAFQRALGELIECGFVNTIRQFGMIKKNEVYRLNDEFTGFYHKFMQPNSRYYKGVWAEITQTQPYKIWLGNTFEYLVVRHFELVKRSMGVNGIVSDMCIHYYDVGKKNGIQIDVLLDRKDNTISYCEIKFTSEAYNLDMKKSNDLQAKIQSFREKSKSKKYIECVFITNIPIKETAYSNEFVSRNILIKDLFVKM